MRSKIVSAMCQRRTPLLCQRRPGRGIISNMALSRDRSDDDEDETRSPEIEHYFHPYDASAQEHSEYVPERDYFSRYLRNKPAEDAEFEPALQDLLTRLYDRQRASADEILDFYMRRFNNSEFDRIR